MLTISASMYIWVPTIDTGCRSHLPSSGGLFGSIACLIINEPYSQVNPRCIADLPVGDSYQTR